MVELYQPLLRGEHFRVSRVDEGLEVVARLLPRGPVLPVDLIAKAETLGRLTSMGVQLESEDDIWLVAYAPSSGPFIDHLGEVLAAFTR